MFIQLAMHHQINQKIYNFLEIDDYELKNILAKDKKQYFSLLKNIKSTFFLNI